MDSREFEFALHDLEKRLDRLRALYEQYFRGYERIEPLIARKDLERRLYAMRKEQPRNTAMRFRFQQLLQRYTMFTTRWGRLTRQIEDGTHPLVLERLARKKQRVQARGVAASPSSPPVREGYELNIDETFRLDELLDEAEQAVLGESLTRKVGSGATQDEGAGRTVQASGRVQDDDDDSTCTGRYLAPVVVSDEPSKSPPAPPPTVQGKAVAKTPRTVPASVPVSEQQRLPVVRSFPPPVSQASERAQPSSARRFRPVQVEQPSPRATPSSGLAENRVRAIYQQFAEARRANNQPDVNYETVARRIEGMLPELRKKHGGRDIDFEVIVRNGRVALKPRTR